MRRTLTITLGLIALYTLVAPTAHAQTSGYPPACTTTASASALGSASIGSTITLQLQPTCAWTPGSAVEVVVNGQGVGTKTADANGFVTVTITVLSATSLSVDDPVIVPTVCGTNTVTGRGTSTVASGAVVTHQATFTVACGAATPAAGATPTARVAFTGANVSRWAAVALAALVGGALLLVAGRRRRVPPTRT